MPVVMEAIDRMSATDRVKTLEYLWTAMTAVFSPEHPSWHADVLDGYWLYERQAAGLGDYFSDTMYGELGSLW